MSFYGEQPKLNELNFKFSAYYPSRKALIEDPNFDNIEIGQCILINYYISTINDIDTLGLISNEENESSNINENENSIKLVPGRYDAFTTTEDGNFLTVTYKLNDTYLTNLNDDLSIYNNSYHNTVWQKVSFNGITNCIMIAELNSIAPQLQINLLPSGEITTADNAINVRNVYTIKDNWTNSNTPTVQDLISYLNQDDNSKSKYAVLNMNQDQPLVSKLQFTEPSINLQQSSELGYDIRFPKVPNFLFNLTDQNVKNDETHTGSDDSIYVAYEPKTDSYVLNMFLGNFRQYMDNVVINGEIVDALKLRRDYWSLDLNSI